MVSKRARASGASQDVLKEPTPKRSRSECAILPAQAKSYVLKRLLWHRPRDDVAGATGPAPSCYTGSKLSETALLIVDNGTGSIGWVDNGMGLRWSPVGVTTHTEFGDPHSIVLACYTISKWSNTVTLKGKYMYQENGRF